MTMNAERGETHVFIDGQNFYLSGRTEFGLKYPDFDVAKIADMIAGKIGAERADHVNFYSGMPVARFSPRWFEFWTNKIEAMEETGINTFTRPLRYTYETDEQAPNGVKILSTREKGIDLRLALDVMAAARRTNCEKIVIASRDQDFREVVEKIEEMCAFERRDIELWSAYPDGGQGPAHIRGIDGMQNLPISFGDYRTCRDATDYRGSFKPSRRRRSDTSPASPA